MLVETEFQGVPAYLVVLIDLYVSRVVGAPRACIPDPFGNTVYAISTYLLALTDLHVFKVEGVYWIFAVGNGRVGPFDFCRG